MSDDDRRARGEDIIKQLFGGLPSPSPTTKPLMDVTTEHLFGDIWSRPGLALRDRSMITVAALTVMGREPQLKVHMKGALNLGVSREEITEMMIHLAHYGGWPTGVTGLTVAQSVFDELDAES